MSSHYRVALSGDFLKADGSPVFPDFDLEPLRRAPGVEVAYLRSLDPVRADQLADFDALILLPPPLHPRQHSIPTAGLPSWRVSASGTTPSTWRPAPEQASRLSSRRTASAGR